MRALPQHKTIFESCKIIRRNKLLSKDSGQLRKMVHANLLNNLWKKTVRCKWIFTVKHNANGTTSRFKTRLIVKRFTQIYDIDY